MNTYTIVYMIEGLSSMKLISLAGCTRSVGFENLTAVSMESATSGLLRRVAWEKYTDVSKERTVYGAVLYLLLALCWLFTWLIHRP
jgi:hypothetical protein